MVKQAVATKTKPKTTAVVAKGGDRTIPAAIANRVAKDAGKGLSRDQADNLVPLIYILQSNSPQAAKRNPAYIEGAEPGSIWLRNSSDPIVSGEDGILFQPCLFQKDWVEWIPREKGGGFVGRHPTCPPDAQRKVDPKDANKIAFIRKNGNEVKETRYHIGYVILDDGRAIPYVIPMTSSGHTVSRDWMTRMNNKLQPNGAGAYPSFVYTYHLKTRERTNAKGTWYAWEVEDADAVQTEEEYERGLALHDSFARGEKKVDVPLEADGGAQEDPPF